MPPDAVKNFAMSAIGLIPEAQTSIQMQDQKRKINSGGGKSGGIPSAINFTASEAVHELHIVMMQILGDYDLDRAHIYRSPLDAAKEIRDGYLSIAELDRIEDQLHEGRHLLRVLTREIDLPPEPIPLGECECGEPMVAVEGDEEVVCKRCELPWEVDERKANRRNRILATLEGQTFTATSAHQVLKQCGINIPVNTIRTWAHRGEVAKDDDGRYSLNELITRALQDYKPRHITGIAN